MLTLTGWSAFLGLLALLAASCICTVSKHAKSCHCYCRRAR